MSLTGKIHSVFNRTFNVVTKDNQLYTVVQSDIFNGSRQIKISVTDFSLLKVKSDMKIVETKTGIVINQQEINIEQAEKYVPIKLIFPEKMSKSVGQITNEIHQQLNNQLDTVGFYRKNFETDVEQVLFDLLINRSANFIQGIKENNSELIQKSIIELLGLGHGLTPSGDDFLTGASLVLNSQNYPFSEITQKFNKTILANLANTNLISGNELSLAINGKSLEPILEFIQQLFDGKNKQEIQPNIDLILKIGSSSGSDILAGIIEAVKVTIDKLYELT